MSINSYLQKCSYKIGGLNKHIYLVDKKDMTISIEANRKNVLFKLKENSIVYKMQCDLVTYRQESSTYSKYRFKNILTVLLTESKNNPNFYVLDKLRKNNYYIIFEDKKGNQYLSNPELFTKLYYEYTFNNDGNVCELNFENLTNFPLLIASKNITSNELLNEKKCDYNYGIPQKLYITNKEKMLITSDNVKASSVYAEKLETVDFLENSLTLVEKYENNVFTTSLKFSIQLDDNQFNWHYNLLEYNDNVYSCILYTTNKNYIIFGTDGMIPQIDVETSDEDENLNIINIKLTQTSQYPMLYSDSLTNKKWVFEGNTRCIGFDKYQMLKQYTSNDEGKTWKPTIPEVLIRGEIIEKNSEECYISEWREDSSECRIRDIHFEDWRVVPNEYICEVGRKYEKTRKYVSSEGNNWDATDEYGKGSLLEEYSNDCAYVTVRWVEDNRTTCKEVDETKNREVSEEICISLDLYNKWNEEVTADGINFYPSGKFRNELIEKNSLKCGYVPEPQYQWVNRGYVCKGYDKYNQEYEQISNDGGLTWKDTGKIRIGSLIEKNSTDCGYVPPTPIKGDLAFEFSGNEPQIYEINNKQYTATTSPFSVDTKKDLGINTITSMDRMFWQYNDNNITKITKIPDTSSVTDMSYMFINCYHLTNLDLSGFNTSKVTSMDSMFNGCTNLTNLDVSSFDTSNVTYMPEIFSHCANLTELNLSNFNTSKVTNMGSMFYKCSSLTSLDLSNFNTSNVTFIGGMFSNCNKLTELDLSNFNTSKATTMGCMFDKCTNLTNLDVSSFDTSKVTDMSYMFEDCTSLTNLYLSNFNTSSVANMGFMFSNCNKLTELDLSNFNTSNVTNMSNIFYKCSSLTSLDLSSFDTSKVTNMGNMFENCTSLTTLDLSNFKINKVFTQYHMFYGSTNLKTIYMKNCSQLTIDSIKKQLDTDGIKNVNIITQ